MSKNAEQLRQQISRCEMLSAGRNPDRPHQKRKGRGHDGKLFCKYSLRRREQFLRNALQMAQP